MAHSIVTRVTFHELKQLNLKCFLVGRILKALQNQRHMKPHIIMGTPAFNRFKPEQKKTISISSIYERNKH